MKQKTAKTIEEVREFVETRPHHRAGWEDDDKHFYLAGYGYKLRVPVAIWRACTVYAAGHLDKRMFRWKEEA